jgi:thiamine phosphate synthase YjbQ (UPF0047 family)
MQQTITINTDKHNALYDITGQVKQILIECKIENGLVNIYAQEEANSGR